MKTLYTKKAYDTAEQLGIKVDVNKLFDYDERFERMGIQKDYRDMLISWYLAETKELIDNFLSIRLTFKQRIGMAWSYLVKKDL